MPAAGHVEPSSPIVRLDHRLPTVAGDIDRILRAGYRQEAALLGVTEFPPLLRTAEDITQAAGEFLGWREDGELRAVVELESDGEAAGGTRIASLAVLPIHQGQGLASRLIEWLLAGSNGTVCVSTATANAPAIALYEKAGFAFDGASTTPEGIRLTHFRWQGRG